MRISDWSSDVCSSDLLLHELPVQSRRNALIEALRVVRPGGSLVLAEYGGFTKKHPFHRVPLLRWIRSEEHTSELQLLMSISYAVFCLNKKKNEQYNITYNITSIQRSKDKTRLK